MGRPIRDLSGMTFSRLTVLEHDGFDRWGASRWKVRCKCGTEFSTLANSLLNGDTRSCGCLRREVLSANIEKLIRAK